MSLAIFVQQYTSFFLENQLRQAVFFSGKAPYQGAEI
jgi:hypothetical protein